MSREGVSARVGRLYTAGSLGLVRFPCTCEASALLGDVLHKHSRCIHCGNDRMKNWKVREAKFGYNKKTGEGQRLPNGKA